MKKKVLALLWAFNNPAWAFILAKELYDGLDGLAGSIEPPCDGMKPNLTDEEGKLIDYLRKVGFTSADDFVSLWDAIVENKDQIETGLSPVFKKAAASDDDDDDYWDEDDEEPSNMHRPIGKRKGKPDPASPLAKWKALFSKIPDDIKKFVHPYKEPQMVEDKLWYQQVWEEVSQQEEIKLISEIETLLNEGNLRRAVKSIYDISYIIKNKYNLSRSDFQHLLTQTQISDLAHPGVWGDLRALKETSPILYTIAEELAWG